MTQEMMLTLLTDATGVTDTDTLLAYLTMAGQMILNRCYPFEKTVTEVPECYKPNQVEWAAYLINKRGAEGETRHNENGIDRTYEAASIPDSMLRQVVPYAKVLGG